MKKFITAVVAAVAAIGAATAATGCTAATPTALEDGKLTIGYTIYAPMNYFDDDTNEFVGFDTELARAFTKKMGVEADFVEIEWNNKFIDLASGTIDCIWNGMTITDDVKEQTAVSAPYYVNKQVIVCRSGNADKFSTKESVASASSVAYEKGSAGESTSKTYGGNGVEVTAQRDALLEVKAGTSEIAIVDITMAQTLTGVGTGFPDLTYVDVGFDTENFGVAFRKSDAFLARAFDLFIELVKIDGTYDSLVAKYLA